MLPPGQEQVEFVGQLLGFRHPGLGEGSADQDRAAGQLPEQPRALFPREMLQDVKRDHGVETGIRKGQAAGVGPEKVLPGIRLAVQVENPRFREKTGQGTFPAPHVQHQGLAAARRTSAASR